MKKRPGYILVLTLMVISLAVGLVTAIVRQSFNYRRLLCSSFDKGRARLLALSSLEIALSQVSLVMPKDAAPQAAPAQAKPSPANAPQEGKKDPAQQWAEKALPFLNRWQTFDFDGSTEGLEGSVRIYIASENGKINIVSLDKAPEQTQAAPQRTPQRPPPGRRPAQGAPQPPAPPAQTPVKTDTLAFIDKLFTQDKEVSIKNALKDFKTRFKRPLEDPSELLRIKSFDKYKDLLFNNSDKKSRSLFIMDLFTVATPDVKINPFLLSESLKKLLGFPENKDVKALAKGVKNSMNWATDWDKVFAPVYGKKYGSLDPALKDMLAPSFKATHFSVISYCKVGASTQRMYALLEAVDPTEDISPQSFVFRISRIYWI